MSNFLKRTFTGAIFLVVMVGGIAWNYYSLTLLFFIISMLGLDEFYKLLIKSGLEPQRRLGLLCGGILFFIITLPVLIGQQALLYLGLILSAGIFFAELRRNKQNPFQNIAYTILGIIYIVMPFSLWVSFISAPLNINLQGYAADAGRYNPHLLLGYFFLLWTNDTGAYLVGITIGKHKLWERISPKKTWEGFFGGLILSIIMGYIISLYYPELNHILWMIMAVLVSLFGTMGDLVESVFKRSIDVKESGGILPGHGGILDRFDGVFLSTPFVLMLLQVVQTVNALLN